MLENLILAVPGAVRGYIELLKRFGRRPLLEVLGPAIDVAGNGFRANRIFVRVAEERRQGGGPEEPPHDGRPAGRRR